MAGALFAAWLMALPLSAARADEPAPAVEPMPATEPASPAEEAAQVAPAAPAPPPMMLFEPRSLALGPFNLTPRLSVSGAYNSNVNLTQYAPVASRVNTIAPSLAVDWTRDEDRYQLGLRAERIHYPDSPANNVRNVEGSLDSVHAIDERSALAWRAALQDWHEDVGNSALGELSPTPNRFLARALGGVWRRNLGERNDGEYRAEVEASVSRKTYLNHRETARAGDVTTHGLVMRYLQAPQPGRRWLGELRLVRARYSAQEMALDNLDARWLLGYQWESPEGNDAEPAELTGVAKAGLQTKRFDVQRPRHWGSTWELGLQWRPRASSLWELGSSRAATDAPGDFSNAVLERRDGLSWTEAWRQDLRSTLSVSGSRQRHFYPGGFWRQDRVAGYDVGFRHDLARQWQWGWTHSVAKRKSNIDGAGFTRRVDAIVIEAAW